MKYFQAGFYDIGGQRLCVCRTGWTGELGFEIYSEGRSTDHARLWGDVVSAGDPYGMVYGTMASIKTRRIEAGILDNLTDFDLTMNPFEAGLGAFIDLGKEGVIGRPALLTADRRPLLLGITCARGPRISRDGARRPNARGPTHRCCLVTDTRVWHRLCALCIEVRLGRPHLDGFHGGGRPRTVHRGAPALLRSTEADSSGPPRISSLEPATAVRPTSMNER